MEKKELQQAVSGNPSVWRSGYQRGKKEERENIYHYFFNKDETDNTKIIEGLAGVLSVYQKYKEED